MRAAFIITVINAEKILFEELSKARQGYTFLMEERGAVDGPDKTHRWIVDPLDGTTNFLHGIPMFAISIGLEREDEMVASVIYNPIMDELYTAEKGKGAWLNDKRRLRVSARRKLEECVVSTGIPFRGKTGHGQWLAECATVMKETAGVRRLGAASLDLAWVASGRYDGYWERGLKPWDMAAGLLLIKEAGGLVSDADGGQDMFAKGSIVAGNPHVQKALVPLVAAGRDDTPDHPPQT